MRDVVNKQIFIDVSMVIMQFIITCFLIWYCKISITRNLYFHQFLCSCIACAVIYLTLIFWWPLFTSDLHRGFLKSMARIVRVVVIMFIPLFFIFLYFSPYF